MSIFFNPRWKTNWRAQIVLDGKIIVIGYGKTQAEAQSVYDAYACINADKIALSKSRCECRKCGSLKDISEFYVDRSKKARADGRVSNCKKCSQQTARERKRREYLYPEKRSEYARKRREYSKKLKAEMIVAYGGKCICCSEVRAEFLTIDHIYGGGHKERQTRTGGVAFYAYLRRLGWPTDKYRLLCWNCNCSRGFSGYCPHEKERQEAQSEKVINDALSVVA